MLPLQSIRSDIIASTLVELLRDQAEHRGEQLAFTFLRNGEEEGEKWSYRLLDARARAIAARLQAAHRPGERVLLLYPPGLEFIAAFFGCLYAGAIAVPIYPPRRNHHLQRLEAVCQDADAAIALTTEEVKARIGPWLADVPAMAEIDWYTTDQWDETAAVNWQPPDINGETLAFLQYTSGSTGNPKGVMVTHTNLLYNCADQAVCWEFGPDSINVTWLPVFHDMGLIYGILQPLYHGVPCYVMAPAAFLQRPARWLQAISRYRATHSAAPNFAYELCARKITAEERSQLDLSCWQMAMNGAEPVRPATLAKFAEVFGDCGFNPDAQCPGYGLAESTLKVTAVARTEKPRSLTLDPKALASDRIVLWHGDPAQGISFTACGAATLETRVVIANPQTLAKLAPYEIGEIWIGGPSVARGYWRNPEATQRSFDVRLSNCDEGTFFRTGDLGFLDDRGALFVTGRLKDLIIIDGSNYYPQDIEATVENCHPGLRVGASAAFAIADRGREHLVIVQELERTYVRNKNLDEITATMRRAIAERHELPVHSVLLLRTASIPKTSSGKIQRQACRRDFLAGTLNVVRDWSCDPHYRSSFLQLSSQIDVVSQQIQAQPAESQPTSAEAIATLIEAKLAQRLGLTPAAIDRTQSFVYHGLTSREAVELLGELETELERTFAPTILWDYPTLASLARHMAGEKLPLVDGVAASPSQQPAMANEAIAIVGMSCRFPGASNPEELWQLLMEGKDAITDSPADRDRLFPEEPAGTRQGGYLPQIDRFDPEFFGISQTEAARMDPQQRLLMEVTWEALERAGILPQSLAGSETGVFLGLAAQDYAWLQLGNRAAIDAYAGTGNAHSIAANRLSYWLDLRGPSLAVDTACSASLVAVRLAARDLRSHDCDLAIAGGANLILNPRVTLALSEAGMMAEDDRCKTFDARADGYVRSEGCGVVLLKRLADAQRDGDRVLAVLRGEAVTQDGRTNGLTAPNGLAQQAVIRKALAQAQLQPQHIGYVQAHGTGTPLGDPIEMTALKSVLGAGRTATDPCWIGSVKANIGHLEAAAGIAGLIQTVLVLQHGQIPPQPHLHNPNPLIDFEGTPFRIATTPQAWPAKLECRRAGVSSFGFGGTNAHVILEESPSPEAPNPDVPSPETATAPAPQKPQASPLHLLTLSARQVSALKAYADRYHTVLPEVAAADLADLCYTANARKTGFRHRLAIAGESVAQIQTRLAQYLRGEDGPGIYLGRARTDMSALARSRPPEIVFLFSGQGCQYLGMGRQLYETIPLFRATLETCDEILRPLLERSLIDLLYHAEADYRELNETRYTQPALFALEYALAKLWQSWGIPCARVIGHSLGEYVAACIAGVFSLEDGLKLVAERGRLMQSLPSTGAMISVFAPSGTVADLLKTAASDCTIAAINSPGQTVVSGSSKAIAALSNVLATREIASKTLQVSHAFHSSLMRPMLADFEKVAASITYAPPQLPIISNVTGQIATADIATPDYWVQHICEPVRFATGMQTLAASETAIAPALTSQFAIEIGPHSTLLALGQQCLPGSNLQWLPSLRRQQGDWETLIASLAELSVRGVAIDWEAFYGNPSRRRLLLPTYPFQRHRCWLEGATGETSAVPVAEASAQESEDAIIEPEARGTWLPKLERVADGDRVPLLIQLLQQEFARVLGRADPDDIEPNRGFFEMGFDSLSMMTLKARLENKLDCTLSATLGFNYPTLEALAVYLLQAILELKTDRPPIAPIAISPDPEQERREAIEQLSEAETEALLWEKLQAIE
ncbi:MAG: beta-ketoacyl synthase N-terminal-like domain-containing protein [Cyanobacteria bacterium P01_G01_bin.54]